MLKVLALTGYKGSGKSYCAKAIADSMQYATVLSFAQPIKEILSALLGHAEYFHDPALKEQQHPNSDKTARQLMVELGDTMRTLYPDVFAVIAVHRALQALDNGTRLVLFDDLRFANEHKHLAQAFGFAYTAWRVERPGVERSSAHKSEAPLNEHFITSTLQNDDALTAEQLTERVVLQNLYTVQQSTEQQLRTHYGIY